MLEWGMPCSSNSSIALLVSVVRDSIESAVISAMLSMRVCARSSLEL